MSKGTVSINAENIMPVIKQWLYSDKDIFMRELVSNGCDAIRKLRWLVSNGQAQVDDAPERIDVIADKEKGTLTFVDNGIGMTEEEIVKYIAQVAFSGAIRRKWARSSMVAGRAPGWYAVSSMFI